MRRVLLTLLMLSSSLSYTAAQQTVATFEGTAKTWDKPLSVVRVELLGNGNTRSATTDQKGHFILADVTPGLYYVNVRKDGYVVPGQNPASTQAALGSITFSGGDHIRDFGIAMVGTG